MMRTREPKKKTQNKNCTVKKHENIYNNKKQQQQKYHQPLVPVDKKKRNAQSLTKKTSIINTHTHTDGMHVCLCLYLYVLESQNKKM